jgi:Flp pilus assembly protein TadG
VFQVAAMAAQRSLAFVRKCLREFRASRRANVSITFALATIPMMGFVGAAVDYSQANSVRSAMQAAADSTALMLSKTVTDMTEGQVSAKANDTFKSLFTRPEVENLLVRATYTKTNGSQINVNATTSVKTGFMRMMGFSELKIAVNSKARWGTGKLQVALALDNTGSMASAGKMVALKFATLNLLDMLKAAATHANDVNVALIPFSKNVNVGSSNHHQPWIDWEEWDDDNGHDVRTVVCNAFKTGRSGRSKKKCATSVTWVSDSHTTWNGCVTDRDQDYDIRDTAPTPAIIGTLFPADQDGDCPAQLMGLTNNWVALVSQVDKMRPSGNTNQPIGLAWAWHALSPGQPLNAPAKSADMQRIIILLSDGLNTENRWDNDQAPIDARQKKLCENIKAAGITIYAVQVNTGSDPLSLVMQGCASGADKFFMLRSANQLLATFSDIGTKISKLRIAQ